MRQPILTAGTLALGLALAAAPAAADSEMEQRFREQGKAIDLTGFLTAGTDARSRRFLFGGPQSHDFSVAEAGLYRFESEVAPGHSDDYRIVAELRDDRGTVIARQEALGQNGGLALRQRLEPGDYVLRVEAQRFGTRSRSGDSYTIEVVGLDAEGRPREDGVSDGEGLYFAGETREGQRSVFVKGENAVATLGGDTAANAEASGAAEEEGPDEAASPEETDSREGFDTIVTDVKIRARGEALTFEMAEPGSVAITTSTYPPGYEDSYRIELEVRDASGRVVAEGAGEGFDGDVDMTTDLAPGRYRIHVQGQKFGTSREGVNNYELRVERR
ncbi:hypothetical protein LG302_14795 [Halomonas organivorans]